MLEIRNLTKVYRSKTGDSVKALDNVSISFPETGMVFILGKSGSGKSTLLNVMGGLDGYDEGEFIIKGRSSKEFGGSDFDAYRNTFIGFIFQEYNVLNDFNVGANIALALELQGKKATTETINKILAQVDLLNFAKRKPNELSGGQKQRVAIARALVKDPQIIMADEPTGALDSNTGKQIFDTLKRLSREKLVLIVSHDRDFAERYADRIVELADGKICSDVTKHERESEKLTEGIDKLSGQILRIKNGYRLTEEDVRRINEYLSQTQGDVILSGDRRVNDELRSAAGISESGSTAFFEGTDEKDYTLKKYEKKDSKFIRSRLPLKNALRMGSSGLKHKKFRLVMTILLSLLAFTMFGFADTMAGYNKIDAAVESISDSNVKNASITVNVRRTVTYGDGEVSVSFNQVCMNEKDLEHLRQTTGLSFVPVFTGADQYGHNGGFPLANHMTSYQTGSQAYSGMINGLVATEPSELATAGFTVSGRLPQKEGEIAITELMYRQLNQYGFVNATMEESIPAGKLEMTEGSPNSIIGKHYTLTSSSGMTGEAPTYEIVGVVDTQFDYERYKAFLPKEDNAQHQQDSMGNAIAEMVLSMELESELAYGFHGLLFMQESDIEKVSSLVVVHGADIQTHMAGWQKESYIAITTSETEGSDKEDGNMRFTALAGSDALSRLNVTWLDGVPRTTLKADEVVIPSYYLDKYTNINVDVNVSDLVNEIASEYFGKEEWEETNRKATYIERIGEAFAATNQQVDMDALYLDLAEAFYLVELPTDMSAGTQMTMVSWLQETSDEKPEVSIAKDTILSNLRYAFAEEYVMKGQLWKKADFIELMKQSEQLGDVMENWNTMDESEKTSYAINFLAYDYLSEWGTGYANNAFGEYSGEDLEEMATATFQEQSGVSLEDLVAGFTFRFMERDSQLDHETELKTYNFKIVGVYSDMYRGEFLISDVALADYKEWSTNEMPQEFSFKEEFAPHETGIWSFALAPIGTDKDVIRNLITMNYDESGDLQFQIHNAVMNTLDTFNEFIEIGSKVFLYLGIGFAVFASLLLMNFIATSISYKRREIGVLRAVGARSSDVFKIFFSEALIIALINFVLSTAMLFFALSTTNVWMREHGINVTLLNYGPRQFFLMLLISVGVALISSFLPVYGIARRKPVDTIKNS